MARFRYLGEPPMPGLVVKYGPTIRINIPRSDGTWDTFDAPDQDVGFAIGEDIGVDITDARSLRCMRANERYEEII